MVCGNFVRQPPLAHFDYRVGGDLAGASRVKDCALYLGGHPDMTDDEVGHIIETVKDYLQ